MRLGDARPALQEAVASGQDRGEHPFHHVVLTDDDSLDLDRYSAAPPG